VDDLDTAKSSTLFGVFSSKSPIWMGVDGVDGVDGGVYTRVGKFL